MSDSLQDRFAAQMGSLLGPEFPSDIALAVSGGGDSMAMLTLAHNWTHRWGVRLWVVTVDHGLRDDSAAEARMVAKTCAELGWPHAILRWHWDGNGNLQAQARAARLQLIDRWRGGLDTVLMAHTADDVAETFLMRLARGSGVDGLAAMADSQWVSPHPQGFAPLGAEAVTQTVPPPMPTRRIAGVPGFSNGFRLVRPLLTESRADLRHYLQVLKGTWVEDPSNDNPRFDRVRWRRALPDLAAMGLDVSRLGSTARAMARAGEALDRRAADLADRVACTLPQSGEVLLDRTALADIEAETQLRLLARALQWVTGQAYRPRLAPLETLLDRILAGGNGTLHGCELRIYGDQVRIFREYAAVTQQSAMPGDWWDGRFRISGAGGSVRALGDAGWAQVGQKTPQIPYHAARSLPALFDGETLISCPALSDDPKCTVEFISTLGLFPQSRSAPARSWRHNLSDSD